MQLTMLGGGGFRVPLVYRALLSDDSDSRVDEPCSYDVDPATAAAGGRGAARLEARRASRAPGDPARDRPDEAVRGTDFVFSAIRVGGLEGRVCDERVALDEGVLGQETTGAGGICYGLRTVPVAMRGRAPDRRARPGRVGHQLHQPGRHGDRGDGGPRRPGGRDLRLAGRPVPAGARALGVDLAQAAFDYAGLNHLGWLRGVLVDGVDGCPTCCPTPTRCSRSRRAGFRAGVAADDRRRAQRVPLVLVLHEGRDRRDRAAPETRGEFLLRQQGGFYAGGGGAGDAYAAWERTRRDREESYMADSRDVTGAGERDEDDLDGGGYDRVALALMRAIARDERRRWSSTCATVDAPGLDRRRRDRGALPRRRQRTRGHCRWTRWPRTRPPWWRRSRTSNVRPSRRRRPVRASWRCGRWRSILWSTRSTPRAGSSSGSCARCRTCRGPSADATTGFRLRAGWRGVT